MQHTVPRDISFEQVTLQTLGAVSTLAAIGLAIASVPTGGATLPAAVKLGATGLLLMGAPEIIDAGIKENADKEKKQLEDKGYIYYNDNGAFNQTKTDLNYWDNATARQIGAAVGRGETNVDVGGVVINIHAPTGNAEDIKNAVARGTGGATEVMRQQFEELDREFASPYYA